MIFGPNEKQLDQEDKVNFKIDDVKPEKHKNAIHQVKKPNSRSKKNQAMKFGQLRREYLTWETFYEKSNTECGGGTIPRPVSKISSWAYLWINSLKFYAVWLYCMPSWELSKYIETKLHTTCFYPIQSFCL